MSSVDGSSFKSAKCNSVSSSFGTISAELVRVSNRDSDRVLELLNIVVSKLGVVIGESLADDIEGCGEELVLRRACAPGGDGPKERVEIIRSIDECLLQELRISRHWTSKFVQSVNCSERRGDVELAQVYTQAHTQGACCIQRVL